MGALSKLYERIKDQNVWGHREITKVIEEWANGEAKIGEATTLRPTTVEIGDIVLFHIAGLRHPSIIFKLEADHCHAVVLSTKNRPHHHLKDVENSRLLPQSNFTTTVVSMTNERALENFIGIFDNPKELKIIKKMLRKHFRSLLKQ